MDIFRKFMPLLLVLTIPFVIVYADVPAKTISVPEQILQQINSLFHVKPDLSFDLSKKQVVEYSMIAAIVLVVIVVIASSARSKTKPKVN